MSLWKTIGLGALAAIAIFGLATCGSYNGLVQGDETINGKSGEVRVEEQKRFDLVPQLVEVVESAANFERGTITEVTEARAKVGQLIQLDPATLADPEMQKQLVEASEKLSSGLSKLIAVAENYPQLKSVEGFATLQTQLEGIENRIAYARKTVQEATVKYNADRRFFPTGVLASALGNFKERPYFEATAGSSAPPVVDINIGN